MIARTVKSVGSISMLGGRCVSGWYCFERDVKRVRFRNREVQLLKTDHSASRVFHEHVLFTGLFTDVLTRALREPDGQRLTFSERSREYICEETGEEVV